MTIALSRRAFIRASLSAAGGLAIAAFGPEFAGATTIAGEPWSVETGKEPDEVNASRPVLKTSQSREGLA